MSLWTFLDGGSAALLGGMLVLSLINWIFGPRLDRPPARESGSVRRVSLLIPARNEAETLRSTLPHLARLADADLQILLLDDSSEDSTWEVATRAAALDHRFEVLPGRPLPPGWLGKNWACHQLAEAASGDVLIFCDSDVEVGTDAVRCTVAWLDGAADAVTALPRHRLGSWAERAVVPLLAQLPVLTMLPLPLVHRVRSPAVAMGNGQWMAFRRDAYDRAGGHAGVRGDVLEDMALARRVKESGARLAVLLASRSLRVRMYRSAAEVREGFSKNVYQLVGGRPRSLGVTLILFYLSALHPFVAALHAGGTLLPLALLVGIRLSAVAAVRHPISSVLAHPLGALLTPALAVHSALAQRRGSVSWRGRQLSPSGRR